MMLVTHLSFALLAGLAITKYIDFSANSYLFVVFVLLASVIPDVDCSDSVIGRRFRLLSVFVKHRGFFHSITFAVALAIIVFLITQNSYYAFAIIIGFSSHIILDSFTRAGTSPFWPGKLRIKGKLRTGRLVDGVLFFVFLISSVLMWI